jgi:hypothetical protein
MFRPIFLTAVLLLSFLVPTSAGEGPVDGDCDTTGLLVCAGANAGAVVECALVTPTSAACSWTHGDIWTAYSPTQLSGSVDVESEAIITTCLGGICSAPTEESASESCTWLPAMACDGDARSEGDAGPVTLAMGQCYRVTVTRTISVAARTPAQLKTLATTSWSDEAEGAGEVCLVDDGR